MRIKYNRKKGTAYVQERFLWIWWNIDKFKGNKFDVQRRISHWTLFWRLSIEDIIIIF